METDTSYDSIPSPVNEGPLSTGIAGSRGNITGKSVSDYGAPGSGLHGALLSGTNYQYWHDTNITYAEANIADRVSRVSVFNASGLVEQTTTAYDNFTQTAQPGLASPPGWTMTNHDSNFGVSTSRRGLPTSVTKCTGTISSPCATSVTTYTDYNILGQPTVTADGNQNLTKYTYSSGSAPNGVDSGLALITTTTMPTTTTGGVLVAHVVQAFEDYNTGLSIGKMDQNGNITTQTYDSRMRPLVTARPDGGTTTNSYPNPNQTRTDVTEDSSRTATTTTDLDDLGRAVSVSSSSD
jgi:YD repeat-containing protein